MVLIFLQDWRATLLPMIDVPVSLIGTFAVMALLGFSLNNLTLFGLVLAIGIVVDDAIVVVENIERWMAKGLPPREATIKAMDEVTGPVIAITLVLSSVFIPTAFIAGHHRPVLPAVRADDRRVDHHLGHQRDDDDPGACRDAVSSRTHGGHARGAAAVGVGVVDRRLLVIRPAAVARLAGCPGDGGGRHGDGARTRCRRGAWLRLRGASCCRGPRARLGLTAPVNRSEHFLPRLQLVS